jgi:hypothetical protein
MFKQRWEKSHEEFVLSEFASGKTGREIHTALRERFGANYSFHAVHTKIGRLRGTVKQRSAPKQEKAAAPPSPTSAEAMYAHLPDSYRQLLLRVEAYHSRSRSHSAADCTNGQARSS